MLKATHKLVNDIINDFNLYWKGLPKTECGLPALQDLRMHTAPQFMPHIVLLDMQVRDHKDYVHILYSGSDKYNLFRKELAGEDLLIMFSQQQREIASQDFRTVLSQQAGLWIQVVMIYENGNVTKDEILCLPIIDKKTGKKLICMLSYGSPCPEFDIKNAQKGTLSPITPSHWLDIGFGIPDDIHKIVI